MATRKRKPDWAKTNVPWDIKKGIWERWALGETVEQTLIFLELHAEEYKDAPTHRDTIREVREELLALPLELAQQLVNELPAIRSFVEQQKPDLEGKLEERWSEQTLDSAAEKEQLRGHDTDTFGKSDAIMSEGNIRDFLASLWHGHHYHRFQSTKVLEFLSFFNYESNQYASMELANLADTVCEALDKLYQFLCDNFYDNPLPHDGGNTQYRLHPYYEVVERQGRDETKWEEDYGKLQAELENLVNIVQEAYKVYRAHIKQTLYK